ncbi:MAG: HAMP domain-containing histidine kinase, partial [Deltaproteobacteria bacterium]|nr:HAMP domain-containing histidine kinase [Deltaproteobacteria bacterium]
STVYGIIDHHNGWIDVKSRQGQGTTFTITLPVASADDA